MKGLKNLRIKYQFWLLTGIAVVLVLCVQLTYYIKLSVAAEDKAKAYTKDIVQQIEANLESTLSRIIKIAYKVAYSSSVNEFLTTTDEAQRYSMHRHILELAGYLEGYNDEIADIVLIDNHEKVTSFFTNFEDGFLSEIKKCYDFSSQKEENDAFLYLFDEEANRGYYAYVLPVYDTRLKTGAKSRAGTAVILCKTQNIINLMKNTAATRQSTFLIVNEENTIIASNGAELNYKKYDTVKSTLDNYGTNLVLTREFQTIRWKIVGIIPSAEIIGDLDFFKSFAAIVGLIMVLMLVLMGMVFNRNIAQPVTSLVKNINGIGESNIKQRLLAPVKNEIGSIADNINMMLDKIEMMTKKIFETQQKMYEIELSKNQAELNALQSQVNPHFLYNTLQCIRGLAIQNDVEEIAEISTAMADIFRYCLHWDGFVPVEDEIQIIRKYIKIMHIRFQGKFSVEMDIADELLNMKSMKMILQPIVENAIFHGLEKRDDQGCLKLRGWLEDRSMIFEITDNGQGIEKGKLEAIKKALAEIPEEGEDEFSNSKSIGIMNINRRIKLILGKAYGVELESCHGTGTTARVRVPAYMK